MKKEKAEKGMAYDRQRGKISAIECKGNGNRGNDKNPRQHFVAKAIIIYYIWQ